MPNTKDLVIPERSKILLVGRSGSGKTTSLGTFPKPTYIMDTDQGLGPLMGQDIEYDTFVDRPGEIPHAYTDIMKKIIELGKLPNPPATVALDSFTTFTDLLMSHVSKMLGKTNHLLDRGDWQQVTIRLMNFINQFTSLSCNTVLVAHSDYEKDDVTGIVRIAPLTIGKLKWRLGMYFSEVYYCEVFQDAKGGGRKYVWYTGSDSNHDAKSRLSGSAGYLDVQEPQDYNKILGKVGQAG